MSAKVIRLRSAESIDGIRDCDIKAVPVDVLGRQPRARAYGDRFLRGPIPWADIEKAAAQGGKALALFLAVHHQCVLRHSRTVKLPGLLLASLSIGRKAAADALDRLERAGLVMVQRHNKSKPVITIVSQPAKGETNA
jgi:hypothetical protein